MSSVRIPLGYLVLILGLFVLLAGARFISGAPTNHLHYNEANVITVRWTSAGLNVREMEDRVTSPYEHALSSLVDQVQGVEAHTYDGLVIVRIIFRPGVDLDTAYYQVSAASEYLRREFQGDLQPSQGDT